MSRKRRVRNLERTVRSLAEPAAVAALAPPADEGGELAREVARAFATDLERYRRHGPGTEQADWNEPPPEWFVEALRSQPPDQTSFLDLDRLSRVEPALAASRWSEVKAAARRDLGSGWLAGRALEPLGGSAWERAVFLAVRDALRRAWPPRHDGEALLLDEMAQYEMLRRKWLGVLALHSGLPATRPERTRPAPGEEPRRLSAAEATAEAVRMVERLQRLFQAALRALLAQRRPRGPVFVRGSGPVNVGVGRTVNFATMPAPAPVFDAPAAGCDNASPPAVAAGESPNP